MLCCPGSGALNKSGSANHMLAWRLEIRAFCPCPKTTSKIASEEIDSSRKNVPPDGETSFAMLLLSSCTVLHRRCRIAILRHSEGGSCHQEVIELPCVLVKIYVTRRRDVTPINSKSFLFQVYMSCHARRSWFPTGSALNRARGSREPKRICGPSQTTYGPAFHMEKS